MGEQIISASGTQFGLIVNPDGTIGISGNSLILRGYPNNQIIRQLAGSPATNFIFSDISRSILVENLGSNAIYFAFNSTANPTSSGTGFMYPRDVLTLDIEIGSISIQSSGATNSEVQVIGIR